MARRGAGRGGDFTTFYHRQAAAGTVSRSCQFRLYLWGRGLDCSLDPLGLLFGANLFSGSGVHEGIRYAIWLPLFDREDGKHAACGKGLFDRSLNQFVWPTRSRVHGFHLIHEVSLGCAAAKDESRQNQGRSEGDLFLLSVDPLPAEILTITISKAFHTICRDLWENPHSYRRSLLLQPSMSLAFWPVCSSCCSPPYPHRNCLQRQRSKCGCRALRAPVSPIAAIQSKPRLSLRSAFTDEYLFRKDRDCLGPS